MTPVPRTMGDMLESMVRIQMAAYPETWSAADKREMAERHLGFASEASACPVTRISETEIGA